MWAGCSGFQLGGQDPPVAEIPTPLTKGELERRVREITAPVEGLLGRGWTSLEARELAVSHRGLKVYGEQLLSRVVLQSRVERFRVVGDCPICQLNLAG